MSKEKDKERLLAVLANINFADRWYALCAKYEKSGKIDPPVEEQQAALEEAGFENCEYQEKHRVWEYRVDSPAAVEVGLSFKIDVIAETILVVKTKHGHVGTTFPMHALLQKRITEPTYVNDPPYPHPSVLNGKKLRAALKEIKALFEDIKVAVLAEKGWAK